MFDTQAALDNAAKSWDADTARALGSPARVKDVYSAADAQAALLRAYQNGVRQRRQQGAPPEAYDSLQRVAAERHSAIVAAAEKHHADALAYADLIEAQHHPTGADDAARQAATVAGRDRLNELLQTRLAPEVIAQNAGERGDVGLLGALRQWVGDTMLADSTRSTYRRVLSPRRLESVLAAIEDAEAPILPKPLLKARQLRQQAEAGTRTSTTSSPRRSETRSSPESPTWIFARGCCARRAAGRGGPPTWRNCRPRSSARSTVANSTPPSARAGQGSRTDTAGAAGDLRCPGGNDQPRLSSGGRSLVSTNRVRAAAAR
jgi:hypothetical protein